MDATTLFLLQLLGPLLLTVGCSILLYRKQYFKVVKELRQFSIGYYLAAIIPSAVGLAIILVHNRWNTLPEILVTLMGWGSFLKGITRLLSPQIHKTVADAIGTTGLLGSMGGIVAVLGAYMSYLGFLA